MDDKLNIALAALSDALMVVWENNGNIMADAIRDSVMTSLYGIIVVSFGDIEAKDDNMVENAK